MSNITVFIYTLCHPITKEVRYIGKAQNIDRRYQLHLCTSSLKVKTKKNSWIVSLAKQGLKPDLQILDEVPEMGWQFWERYWISQFKTWGFKLTNGTDGGDGTNLKNRIFSQEHRRKLSNALKGKKPSPETRKKQALAKIGTKHNLGTKYTDEQRKRVSDAHKGQKSWNKGNTKHPIEVRNKITELYKSGMKKKHISILLGITQVYVHRHLNKDVERLSKKQD